MTVCESIICAHSWSRRSVASCILRVGSSASSGSLHRFHFFHGHPVQPCRALVIESLMLPSSEEPICAAGIARATVRVMDPVCAVFGIPPNRRAPVLRSTARRSLAVGSAWSLGCMSWNWTHTSITSKRDVSKKSPRLEKPIPAWPVELRSRDQLKIMIYFLVLGTASLISVIDGSTYLSGRPLRTLWSRCASRAGDFPHPA